MTTKYITLRTPADYDEPACLDDRSIVVGVQDEPPSGGNIGPGRVEGDEVLVAEVDHIGRVLTVRDMTGTHYDAPGRPVNVGGRTVILRDGMSWIEMHGAPGWHTIAEAA